MSATGRAKDRAFAPERWRSRLAAFARGERHDLTDPDSEEDPEFDCWLNTTEEGSAWRGWQQLVECVRINRTFGRRGAPGRLLFGQLRAAVRAMRAPLLTANWIRVELYRAQAEAAYANLRSAFLLPLAKRGAQFTPGLIEKDSFLRQVRELRKNFPGITRDEVLRHPRLPTKFLVFDSSTLNHWLEEIYGKRPVGRPRK